MYFANPNGLCELDFSQLGCRLNTYELNNGTNYVGNNHWVQLQTKQNWQNHVLKCHIYGSFNCLQDCWCHHFPDILQCLTIFLNTLPGHFLLTCNLLLQRRDSHFITTFLMAVEWHPSPQASSRLNNSLPNWPQTLHKICQSPLNKIKYFKVCFLRTCISLTEGYLTYLSRSPYWVHLKTLQ